MRVRFDSMESLESEKRERKDWVDSKDGGVDKESGLDLVERRDWWRFESRSIIAACLRWVSGSRVLAVEVSLRFDRASSSIDREGRDRVTVCCCNYKNI